MTMVATMTDQKKNSKGEEKKSIHVVVSVAFQDAGDTTRAIAMASALRSQCPADRVDLRVTFLSCGSRFEYLITEAGFPIAAAQPRVAGISVAHDLGWSFPEFFGSAAIARGFIEGQLAALRALRPDVVFHGMWAPASLAARMLGIRTVNFLPVPLHPGAFAHGLIRDLPDAVPLATRLPRPARRWLAWLGGGVMVRRAPIFWQHNLGAAARECGWPGIQKGPISLFDMNMADLNLVNDHPAFHADYAHRLPPNIVITGPLFARNSGELDADIVAHMTSGPPGCHAILVAMGSSGTEDFLLEAIKAFRLREDDNWRAVVLASPSICSVEKAQEAAAGDPRLLVTSRFIPAPAANALADLVVLHGGQGTVQTAVAAGKPIVGVALQMEQQVNLDIVMDAGAGIRVQRQFWKAKTIRNTVRAVLDDPSYAAKARTLGETINNMDGAKTAAEAMWNFILKDEKV